MKKTLLFFLLFLTHLFYAQVNNIVHCAGDTSFNLSSQKAILIGNLNPDETIVSYHLSLADATDNLNAIVNPGNYVSTESSKTIYARIDNNGTVTTNYFNLILNPVLIANTEVVYVNCVPRIVITGSGGDSTYEYSHFGVTYTQTNFINNPSPGNQTVYVRDGNGCVASKTLVVESLSPLTWRAQATNVTCQGANDGTAQITASGGKAPYLFSYGNGNEFTSSNIFKNLSVGTHTINIQDATGCVISLLLNIYQANPSIVMTTTITNASGSNSDGKISLNVSGGVSPYTYFIKDSNGNPIPSKTTNPFTGLAVGSYEVVVTDSKGCTLSQNGINILNTPTPLTTTFAVTPITCVINTGTITITPNGGTLPYQYSIGNGYSNSNVFSNLVAGTYNIMVRDAEGFVVSTTATVDPINLPIITTTYKSILCHGDSNGSILVGASNGKAPNLFSINGGPYTSYNLFENLSAGNYVLSVKDSNGCIVSSSVLLEDPAPITAEITYFDRSVTINASGGYGKYVYALDGGNYQQSYIYSNVSYGNHTIYVKDANNCILSMPITVVKPDPLIASLVVDKGTVTISTSGGILPYHYALQKSSGYPITTTQSNIFTNLVNGSYQIIVTDSHGGQVLFSDVIISESAPFTASATSTLITCTDLKGTVTVTATGGKSPYQYSITSPDNFIDSNVFSNLNAGSYLVTVRDSNNFTTTASVNVASAKSVFIAADIVSEISCNGSNDGVVKVNVIQGQSPYTYTLDGGNVQSDDTFRNLSPGTHSISVMDKNGCTAVMSITLLEPKILKSTVVVNGNTITAYTIDGTAPYTYIIQDKNGIITGPQTSETFTNLPTGLYSLQITDARGCLLVRNNINISETPVLSATAIITPLTCKNPKGTITVTATGGVAPYTYSLNGGTFQANNTFSDLVTGTYSIVVKDVNGNTINTDNLISPYSALEIIHTLTNPNCFGSNDGSINLTATGGIAPYMYSLNNGAFTTANFFNGLQAGNYILAVKDAAGCGFTTIATIAEPAILSSIASATNTTTSADNDGIITVNATGGVAPYVYAITNDGFPAISFQASNVFAGLKAGSYSVQVKDARGCTNLQTNITIANAPDSLLVTVDKTSATCTDPTVTLTVHASGGLAPYLYSLDGFNYVHSNTFTVFTPGAYTISVRDNMSSISTITTITSPFNPLAATADIIKNIDCLSNGSINVTASGGSGNYQYSVNGGPFQASNLFNNLTAGTYYFTIKDSNDCSVLTNNIVLEQPVPLTATVTQTKITDCLANAGSNVSLTAAGGTAPYQYSINKLPYSTNNSYPPLYPGTYSFDIKDAKGCVYTLPLVIKSPSSLIATATINKSTECGIKDSVTISATGGQAPYTYSFDIGVNYTESNTNLVSGVQTFFVKDSNGCQASTFITITPSSLPVSTLLAITNTTSANSNDGSITMNASGGTAPYTYSLLNSNNVILIPAQSSPVFSNLAPGTYGMIAKDAKGCSSTITNATIVAPSVLTSVATVVPVSCINEKGSITVQGIGGIAPYQYSFNGQPYTSNNIFNNLYPGVYEIGTRDAFGNETSLFATISPLTPLTVNAIRTDVGCNGDNSGSIRINTVGGSGSYTYSLYKNGILISPNTNNPNFTNLSAGSYTVMTTDINSGCIVSVEVYITEPTMLSATLVVDNQTLTIHTTGGNGIYDYSMDWTGGYQISNVFTNVPYGIHQVLVRDQNGCAVSISVSIDPPAPLIDGKNTITIEFKAGQTLGDVVVEGQNIKWYSSGNAAKKTNKSSEANLPLSTVLVDGTTYYASQTINGIESTERLAVTAKLNGSLSTPDFALSNFSYYPNPVQHTLSINNNSNIDEVEVFSVSGKSILSQKVNNTHSEIDLSNVSSGFYFLKVKSEGQVKKTIKIMKK